MHNEAAERHKRNGIFAGWIPFMIRLVPESLQTRRAGWGFVVWREDAGLSISASVVFTYIPILFCG